MLWLIKILNDFVQKKIFNSFNLKNVSIPPLDYDYDTTICANMSSFNEFFINLHTATVMNIH